MFNGTTSTESGIVDGSRVSVSADLAAHPDIRAVTVGQNVFLSATFGAQNRIERARTVIHEEVVHVANGRNDSEFAPAGSSNPRTSGSRAINEIIRTNCNRLPP
jgi:hypothetical protein